MRKINIEKWYRADQYHFFKSYAQPYFNVCANVNVSNLYKQAKATQTSFHLRYQHAMLKVVNQIEAFKYRIVDEEVVCFDCINSGTTMLRPDNSFGFCYFDYDPDWEVFQTKAKKSIEAFHQQVALKPKANDYAMIHTSSVPWIQFTSVQHPFNNETHGIPKITFGKYYKENGEILMPVSVQVHHALLDGFHVGLFFQQFEATSTA